MKKHFIFLGTFAIFLLGTITSAKAQCIEEGNIIIDGYYGFPNLYTAVFKAAYANAKAGGTQADLQIKGIGPLGIRGEYVLTEKFGIGLDLGMNNTSITYQETDQVYNNTTGLYDTKTYNYNFKTQKIGGLVSLNLHFVNKDNLDVYGVVGAGYGSRTFKFTSDDPNYTDPKITSLIPVAAKIGIGMRYFFTDNLGANVALGIGQGGIINAGLSAKF